MNIDIHSNDLNSSLVFYRALFNRMPDSMNPSGFGFDTPEIRIRVMESKDIPVQRQAFHLNIREKDLRNIYLRMRRFMSLNQFKEDCETPEDAIGLTDPDGYRWVVGRYREDISFEKCYLNF